MAKRIRYVVASDEREALAQVMAGGCRDRAQADHIALGLNRYGIHCQVYEACISVTRATPTTPGAEVQG